jgi:hypothetical protein
MSPVLPRFDGLAFLDVNGPVVQGNFVGMVGQGKGEGLKPSLCLVAGVGKNQGGFFDIQGIYQAIEACAGPGARPRERYLPTRGECW